MSNSGGEVDTQVLSVLVFLVYVVIVWILIRLVKRFFTRLRDQSQCQKRITKNHQASPTVRDYSTTPIQTTRDRQSQVSPRKKIDITNRSSTVSKKPSDTRIRPEYIATMKARYRTEVEEIRKPSAYKMVNYKYTRRDYIMTLRERKFYKSLFHAFGKYYLIFPQIHLDALFYHDRSHQYYMAAFRAIQRYSVDYVLCDPNFRILCAIELDDTTHQMEKRVARDKAVEDLFDRANLPLIRIPANYHMDNSELADFITSRMNIRV